MWTGFAQLNKEKEYVMTMVGATRAECVAGDYGNGRWLLHAIGREDLPAVGDADVAVLR